MKYYIIAGEASGDLHASNLIKAIKAIDPQARIRAWGGDLMEAQGAELVKHYRDLAFMGFIEVARNIRTIWKNIQLAKREILSFQPDALILVDYPGFNLHTARFAHSHGIRVIYYISPQVWAWKQSRVHTIRRVVSQMLVILPFEQDFYKQFGVNVEFVGHPLLDALNGFVPDINFIDNNKLGQKPIVALLPGSRKQEIKTKLPVMLKVSEQFPEYQFVVAGAPGMSADFYQNLLKGSLVGLVFGQTYQLLAHARAALVTSGTATLETALFNVPQVVCYMANPISYAIARRLVKVKFISLVNLIMGREIVKELIQDELNPQNLAAELTQILDGPHRNEMLNNYAELRQKLGGPGASARAARLIHEGLVEAK
ncbi:MAG: lipid-A-disaccharide synthase [Bacteroidetes bacterium]|nr:lipid-A-disaccharide synthase [Bacteroidota bacterium]